jgi:hypothetical protein
MFPGPSFLALVALEGVHTRHQEATLAVGPQPHIDLVKSSRRRVHGQQVHYALTQAQEKQAVVDAPLALGGLNPAARIVQEHQVKVRPITQFQAAQLAVPGNRDHDRTKIRFIIAAIRGTVRLRHLLPGKVHAALNDQFGDVGEPVADAHQRQPAGKIGQRHREHRDLLELPQCLHLTLRIVCRHALGARRQLHDESLPRWQFIERLGVDQFIQQQRKVGDLPRQKTADRAYLDQAVQRRRLLLEQSQVRGAGADRLQHPQHALHDRSSFGLLSGEVSKRSTMTCRRRWPASSNRL